MKIRYVPLLSSLLLPVLAGCRPEPPSPERPPEPQATALRDAIQQPLDKAHAAEAAVEQAAQAQRAAIDAATDAAKQ
ncbi:hypothetical protein OK348_16910 [Flavobacterium sp. MXW15]|uniref:Lipoprotein n=1 Tax=Xanthomonas chitinilytica TaxID=2989819 RepID=A0ABT3K0A1_9XANT|nr:hypothetical protein [Xanthomonas sp. H13-6]MCW4456462.1 hypothetical protein [Flavobacterium sp. MXW15]MCW4474158.1 hypothetical protein [Xanthomonas sp. H13-6]